jgi:hypothetical protein
VGDIVGRERLRELRLDPLEVPEVREVGQLLRLDGAVIGLREDEDVHDPDDPGVVESQELVRALAGEVLLPSRELDDQVVDGPQLIERSLCHDLSFWWAGLGP